MKSLKILALLGLLLLLGSGTVVAGDMKTVELEVDGMTCRMCPITVRRALHKLDGVEDVEAKYEGHGEGWARVRYDADKLTVAELTRATEMAGYPSRPRQGQGQ